MSRDHIDLTTVSDSDNADADLTLRTPRRGRQSQSQSQSQSQPGSRTRKLASPSLPDRQSATSLPLREGSTSIHATTPSQSAKKSASKSASLDGKMASLPPKPAGSINNEQDATPSSTHHHSPSVHRTPKTQTPRKVDWTTDKLEQALRELSDEIGTEGAKLTARLIHMAWKKEAPKQQFPSKKDWFADMKRIPVETATKSSDTMRIRTKVGFDKPMQARQLLGLGSIFILTYEGSANELLASRTR